MTTAEFLSRFEHVTKTGDGWQVQCPAHNDGTPSLSIAEGDDGRTLIDCKAGCSPESVCAALGITLADLFADKPSRKGDGKKIVAQYPYHDADGRLLFEVVRYAPKDFRQRRPDGKGGLIWNMDGIDRVLFRLPEVMAAIKAGWPIYLTEGEKDALAMVEHGFAATCNAGGAGKWQDSYTATLKGAEVIIIADKDPAGRKHAAAVAGKLHAVARAVKIIELPDTKGNAVKDAADFFAAGGEAADLDAIAEAAPEFEPPKTGTALDAAPDILPGNEEPYAAPDDDPAEAKPLPDIVDASSFLQEKIERPPELVEGVLHQGSKLVFGGGSKTFKTWTLTDLALAVAMGEPWLSFKTKKGRVLFLNFEIQPAFFQDRIRAVSEAKQITLLPGMFDLWNLRGHAAGYASIFPRIIERVKDAGYSLIVLDPIYKCYGDVDENSAGAVAGLMNAIEGLAVATGAAVAFGAHYSKGNQAGKESIDRISGSGVFARDPDSILSFTRHKEQDAFTVELTLRNFKPVAPFVARWLYPLMRRDESLDPAELKKAAGRAPQHTGDDILKLLTGDGLTTTEWEKAAARRGISRRTFYRLKNVLEDSGRITQTKDKWTPAKPA